MERAVEKSGKIKKCAIITYHMSRNNGSFLQAYALQVAVKSLGHECKIVNYISSAQERVYSIFQKNNSFRNIIKNIFVLYHFSLIQKNREVFSCVQKQFLNLTERCTDEFELSQLEEKFDVFISGSDQIWNLDAWDYSDVYFLSFIQNKKKISYASSFGGCLSRISEKDKEKIQSLAQQYSAISVRENSGSVFLSNILQHDIPVVFDPTLLLRKEDYNCIASRHQYLGKYIFLYSIFSLQMDTDFLEQVKNASKKLNLPVFIMYTGNKAFLAKKYGFKLVKAIGPAAFLELIQNAEMVFTSSFHGTAFSLLYEKRFWVSKRCDDRIYTLLSLTETENRILQNNSIIEEPMNYDTINLRINQHREESYAFLKRAILEGI